MNGRRSILLFFFPILLWGQNDTLSEIESYWEEMSTAVEYEKDLEPKEVYRRGYVPPSLPEYYNGELETDEMIFDDVDREELYRKRLVMEREGAAGEAPVKKKIKDISKPKENVDWDQIRFNPSSPSPEFNFNTNFLKILLIIVAIVLLAFFIYQFILKRIKIPDAKNSNQLATDVDLLNPEEHEVEELHQQLQRHLANQDYRSALRVQYLMVLKELIEREKITWKKEKTNYHYQNELSGTSYFEDFHFVLYVFEKAWYGLYQVTSIEYEKIKPRFTKLLSDLKNE